MLGAVHGLHKLHIRALAKYKRKLIGLSGSIGVAEDEEKFESVLKGTTLKVYWHLLKSRGSSSAGVREVQRALRFSSPTLAAYHLDKLMELGLVAKEHGEYRLVKEVKVGVLKQFMRFGAFMLPRYLFYAAMFTMLLVFFAVYLWRFEQVGVSSVFALIFGVLGVVVSWYETARLWRQRP